MHGGFNNWGSGGQETTFEIAVWHAMHPANATYLKFIFKTVCFEITGAILKSE